MFGKEKKISIIGVPSDLGANSSGSRLGPDAIRVAGVHRALQKLGYNTQDLGNIPVPQRFHNQDGANNYLKEITGINQQLFNHCQQSILGNSIPLTLGGDHSLAIGSVAASAATHQNLGLLWIDTHADLNSSASSPTQNIHGMPVSTLLHNGFPELIEIVKTKLSPSKIVMIGLRDIDQEEKKILTESEIHYFTMRDIDEIGIQTVFKKVKELMIDQVDALHVSFDLDVMDPIVIPAVSTPVHGGLSLREAYLLLELIHETNKVAAVDFVELNPMNDIKGGSAHFAVSLIGSLFGSTII